MGFEVWQYGGGICLGRRDNGSSVLKGTEENLVVD